MAKKKQTKSKKLQLGGFVYPVNYVPKAKDGEDIDNPKSTYWKNKVYKGPTEFKECKGEGCSKQATKDVASLYNLDYGSLSPQDAWYKRSAIIKGGGKEIYNTSSNNDVQSVYGNLRVGDFVSLDRPGDRHAKDVSKVEGYTLDDNEQTEHLGYVVGFNDDGVPLIKHGHEGNLLMDAKSYVQPITELSLPDIGYDYKVKSIYRAKPLVENDDRELRSSYYKNISPSIPLSFYDEQDATVDKRKFINAYNKNSDKFQTETGLTPEEVAAIGNIGYGIFGNESRFNKSAKRPIKQLAAEALYALGLRKTPPSLGPTQLKYEQLNNSKNETRKGRLLRNLGVEKEDLDNVFAPTNYDAVTKATFAPLAENYKNLKTNPKFGYNPENNTVLGNVPIGLALAKSWQNPSLKNVKKSLQEGDSNYANSVYRNMAELEGNTFPLTLPEVVVKAKKKKNGGWLDKFEDGGGVESTMDGLTDKGFDYNGAWGGPSMQMGGSMPGAVGFTYARTINPAPSKGKYAKKTMASAQNGGEMKFYQEGLDWNPKNISMNGKKMKKAQLGAHMLTPDYGKVGENMMEMISAPQKALTALVSGKYQTPSQAMNIKNPYGAFIADAILDPFNLIGGGVAAKSAMAAKAAGAAPKASRLNHLKELVKMKQEGVDLSKFFEDLNWTKEGKDLWKEANKYKVNILTGGRELAPGQDAISTGKRLWSKKNLNLEGDNIIVEKQKAKYATPDVILIDDLPDNVNKFREAGGHAILHTNTKKTIKELNKHMAKNPNHKVYMDLDGVLVDLEGGVNKFRGVKQTGGMINKAQVGVRQRAASDNTTVRAPRTDMPTMAESKKIEEAKRIWEAINNQASMQSPSSLPKMSRDQVIDKNIEYARRTGKKVDPNTGKVSPALSPSVAKKLGRLEESILNTAGYALNIPTKVVQSAYKPGYTLQDALTGQDSGSTIIEDMLTDPENLATFGLKGLVKGLGKTLLSKGALAKGALSKGALSKGLLSSAILPFYRATEKDDALKRTFYDKLAQLKETISKPEARDAFERVGELATRRAETANIDPKYAAAITDPDLPIRAIDKYANSLISIDPAENALTAEQVKYLGNIGSLATDFKRIDPYNVPVEERLKFAIDNSKNMSPRDILPYFYVGSMPSSQKNELLERLYRSYGNQVVDNPIAEYTAAADLFGLAETYGGPRFGTTLSGNIQDQVRQLTQAAESARPSLEIAPQFFDPQRVNDNNEEAIHLLSRGQYSGVPTPEERKRNMLTAGREVVDRVKNITSNPANKGKSYVGAWNLSTDSYPLQLGLLARQQGNVDYFPVHMGTPSEIYPHTNSMSGLSAYNSNRRAQLMQAKEQFDRLIGNVQNQPFGGTSLAGTRQLQGQMLEAGLLNSAIADFNKKIGTNMPSAYFSSYDNDIVRPNVGITIKKDGGPVKDNMGYWNPENWGEPVEIGSNEITMQGVYEPLLGISDTGDVQMMYPGEDYTFDGDTVTEYPVMQKGGRAPIYVDSRKDPRLKAYQDSMMLSSRPRKNPNPMVSVSEFDELHYPGAAKNYAEKGIMPIGFRDFSEKPYRASEPVFAKPKQKVEYRKPQAKKEQPVKKQEQPKPVERKQNVYEGSPVYSGSIGSGMPSAVIGFANQRGDTTYIKPEDYERFGVPKYGKEYIESKTTNKKKNGGWLDEFE
jgi:hypothetical protein